MKKLFLITLIFIALASCNEVEIPVETNSKPIIKLESVTPTTIKEFEDSIVIVLQYEDGDGDLGSQNPDEDFLEIRDTRLPKPDYYFVAPLSPPGSKVRIQGSMRVVVRNTFLLGSGGNELTTFEIRMRDRAGNWSNTLTTEKLTITR